MVSVCPSDCLRKYCHKFVSSRICSTSAIRRVPCWSLLGLYAAYLLINSYWNSNSEMCAEWRRWVMFFLFGFSLLYSSEDMVDFLKSLSGLQLIYICLMKQMDMDTGTVRERNQWTSLAWHGMARPGTRKTRFTCRIRFHSIPYSSYSFIHTSISFCCSS